MSKIEYIQTEDQARECAKGLVCDGCGGALTPIETVDNANRPTFWVGCEACQKYTAGVNREIFDIARKMVTEYFYEPYSSVGREYKSGTPEEQRYYLTTQTQGACSTVQKVLHIAKSEIRALLAEQKAWREKEQIIRENMPAILAYIGFSKSVIQSGESWTKTCDDMADKANEAVKKIQPELQSILNGRAG